MRNKKYQLDYVFTPATSASLTYVERETINEQLLRAIKTTGKQIIIYGHSGSGKTTILENKLKPHFRETITTSCESRMTLNDIFLDAFNQLSIFTQSSKENSDTSRISNDLSGSLLAIKAKIGGAVVDSHTSIEKRLLDIPLTPQTLSKYLGETEQCWIIEDFHKIKSDEKKNFGEILKIFMDIAKTYKKSKIVAIGAVNTAREVIQYEPEMKSRVSEIFVPLLSHDELLDIILKGEKLLNIEFRTDVKEKVIRYSHGLAEMTHELCSIMCYNRGIHETSSIFEKFDNSDLEGAIDKYVMEYSDTLKSIYDTATKIVNKRKFEDPKNILEAIINSGKEEVGINDITTELKKKYSDYSSKNLKRYVEELTKNSRNEILRLNKNNNRFSFSNPFIKAYAQIVIHKQYEDNNADTALYHLTNDMKKILFDHFDEDEIYTQYGYENM